MSTAARTPPLVRAALIGATGRMGQALLRAASGFPQLIVTAAIASTESLALGRDAGELAGLGRANLPVTSDLAAALKQADVVIDFSPGAAAAAHVEACRAAKKALLLGSTGYGADVESVLAAAAREIPLLIAPNTSPAMAVLAELTRQAARALPRLFDIDIFEIHHRGKRDAPSGSARALQAAAAAARSAAAAPAAAPPARAADDIPIASVRAGEIVGEHTVLLSGPGEELRLSHRALDRSIFARGAINAALWLTVQAPGRYGMAEFLGFKTGS